jgi:hypothetical protein
MFIIILYYYCCVIKYKILLFMLNLLNKTRLTLSQAVIVDL